MRVRTVLVAVGTMLGAACSSGVESQDAASTAPATSATTTTETSVAPPTTSPTTTPPATTPPTTSPPTTAAPTSSAASTTANPTTTSSTAAPSTTVPGLEQPAIWPAADVVFATPEEAAEDFVSSVLGVPPVLGEFQGGDARSGEIEVLSPGEGGSATSVVRSVLLLRRLGPDDGWFVTAAVNPNAAIDEPQQADEVPAAPLTVEGVARGFEGTVLVMAFVAGDADGLLDEALTQGGALENPEPFEVVLDLSAASQGQVVALLVRGDTGLETDPGDFGAIAIMVRP